MAKSVVADIDEIEAEAANAPRLGADVVPIIVPVVTYRALSDVAARKGMTVVQLLAKVFASAIEEM